LPIKDDLYKKAVRENGLSQTQPFDISEDRDYSAAKNLRMRSSPRSNSAIEVA
jgi:hypothetical protein